MNYYEILGVSRNANSRTIKSAFKQLAIKFHPDKNPGSSWAEERFKDINNAYQVLSDPDKKYFYDLTLHSNYRNLNPPKTEQYASNKSYQTQRRQYQKYHRKYNKELNRKANFWAIGFFVIISLVIAIPLYINSWLKSIENEKMLAKDQDVVAEADQKFDAGIYTEALQVLDQHLLENSKREVVEETKKHYIEQLLEQGNEAYSHKKYRNALGFYKIIYEYTDNHTNDYFQKVARSSREVGNYEDAIIAYKEVIKSKPKEMDAFLQIALIYTYDLKQYDQAIQYYLPAREMTIANYIEEYGKAFVLVFKPNQIPTSHYTLYTGLGLAYHRTQESKLAIEALDWAILLRKIRPEAHYVKGLVFNSDGKHSLACEEWAKASFLGMEEAGTMSDEYCN